MTDPHLDVAGYALDALTDHERATFEAHLAECPECRRRLREFTETTAELSAPAETGPPEHLRGNVLAAIADTPQLDSEPAADQPPATGQPNQTDPGQPVRPGEKVADREPGPGRSIPRHGPADASRGRRNRRWRRIGQIALAAAVAVVLAIGGWVAGRQQLSHSVHTQSADQSRLLSAPDARIHRKPMRHGATVSYVVSQKQNAAMVIVSGNPEPGSGKTFQLWTMHGAKGDQPKPDRTFSGGESQPVWLKTDISSAAAVAITIEPDGGSDQPTTDPFAVQKLG